MYGLAVVVYFLIGIVFGAFTLAYLRKKYDEDEDDAVTFQIVIVVLMFYPFVVPMWVGWLIMQRLATWFEKYL